MGERAVKEAGAFFVVKAFAVSVGRVDVVVVFHVDLKCQFRGHTVGAFALNISDSGQSLGVLVVVKVKPDIFNHGGLRIETDSETFFVEVKTVGRPPFEKPRDDCFMRFAQFVESQKIEERFSVFVNCFAFGVVRFAQQMNGQSVARENFSLRESGRDRAHLRAVDRNFVAVRQHGEFIKINRGRRVRDVERKIFRRLLVEFKERGLVGRLNRRGLILVVGSRARAEPLVEVSLIIFFAEVGEIYARIAEPLTD